MRNATKSELAEYELQAYGWHITVRFVNTLATTTKGRNGKKRFGPFFGGKERAIEQAVQKAREKFPHGTDFVADEPDEYNDQTWLAEEQGWIVHDWKEIRALGGEKVYFGLIERNSPKGLEVVQYDLHSDTYVWKLGPKKK